MIIRPEELAAIRRNARQKKIVLLKGTFDLLHIGHVNRLQAAKELGDVLVVFVKCDEALRAKGPGRLVEDESQRAAVVDAVRYVDYCVIANRKSDIGLQGVPAHEAEQYLRCCEMISDLRPDVLIKPEKKLPQVLANLYRQIGTHVEEVEEMPGISTTILIDKIRGAAS